MQRLALRVKKCEHDVKVALENKHATKQLLLQKIIARDEMAMAVSVAYQRAEEERMDQLTKCMKTWLQVEREHLKFREQQLKHLEDHVDRLDRAADIQLLIHV